jgi:hypothetical protein
MNCKNDVANGTVMLARKAYGPVSKLLNSLVAELSQRADTNEEYLLGSKAIAGAKANAARVYEIGEAKCLRDRLVSAIEPVRVFQHSQVSRHINDVGIRDHNVHVRPRNTAFLGKDRLGQSQRP